jgi:uncharacterized cofD-like protein
MGSLAAERSSVRVVTLGGGHGQATLLLALSDLACDLSAVVSVADDGGCSGRLRKELGIPPPGDVRRCLSSLARSSADAALLERRYEHGAAAGRCVGNFALAELCLDLGSLSAAAERLGTMLGCTGRVIPVADTPGTLAVYDLEHGAIDGETRIERMSGRAVVATVQGPERATEAALGAIAQANLVLFGPGSFVGSTLAVLTTAGVAGAVLASRARRVLVRNIAPIEQTGVPGSVAFEDHERLLADHLVISSLGEPAIFDVLSHGANIAVRARADGSSEHEYPMAGGQKRGHDPDKLAAALAHHFGLERRAPSREVEAPVASAEIERLAALACARLGLRGSR